jgi:hypothetical protein
VLVRILKLKKKSEIKSLLKTPVSGQDFRKTYDRLKNTGHINKETAILMRVGEKLAAENKILRKEVEGLREAIFEEKRKRKRGKALNFYDEGEMEGQGRRTITTLRKKLNLKIKIPFRTALHHLYYQYLIFQYTIS